MNYENILFSLDGGVARASLHRPDKLNAFTPAMHEELAHALGRVESEGARVLVLTGSGRAFCAGQDLSLRVVKEGAPPPDLGASLENYYIPLVKRLKALPMPVVVGVNGVAAGAGANLALAGDIVIAKASASFIQPFCRLGLLPDTGGTYALPRLVGSARAMGLSMLGDKLSAEKAEQWGLIWECVADEARRPSGRTGAPFRAGPHQGPGRDQAGAEPKPGQQPGAAARTGKDADARAGQQRRLRRGRARFHGKAQPRVPGRMKLWRCPAARPIR